MRQSSIIGWTRYGRIGSIACHRYNAGWYRQVIYNIRTAGTCLYGSSYNMAQCNTAVTPVHIHWSYYSLALRSQSSRKDFTLRLPIGRRKHQMIIILTNPTSDIWILRLTWQTCWRDFVKTGVIYGIPTAGKGLYGSSYNMAQCNTAVTPVHIHWSYYSLALRSYMVYRLQVRVCMGHHIIWLSAILQ